jgi:hypothetical protein
VDILSCKWARALIVIATVPAMLAAVAGIWAAKKEEQTWQAQPAVLPNGQKLRFRPAEAKCFGRLLELLGPAPQTRRVAVLLAGGGIHYFFGTQRVGRHWWFLPEFVRPWERESVRQSLLHHDLILIADLGQTTDVPRISEILSLRMSLPPSMAEQILSHLKNPRHIEGVGDLLQAQP